MPDPSTFAVTEQTHDRLDLYGCPESCRCRRYECQLCDHHGCGFCPDCHPEVPDL